jgi:iron complex transport system substrate-binding protein
MAAWAGAGCSRADEPSGGASGDVVDVRHEAGTSRVPARPRRVAVLEARGTLECALALGLPVVALGVDDLGVPDALARMPGADVATRIDVTSGGVDLEQLAATTPDVILTNASGYEYDVSPLRELAPLVVLPNNREEPWPVTLRRVAGWFGLQERAEAAIAEYEQERDAVRARHAGVLSTSTVTAFNALRDVLIVQGEQALMVQTLRDLGGRRPPGQPAQAQELSLEQVDRVDADRLVRFSYGDDDADLQSSLLYQRLPAVRAGRVLTVDGYSANIGGVEAARECLRALDALFALP